MDDAKLLAEALGTVKIQMVQMKRCLVCLDILDPSTENPTANGPNSVTNGINIGTGNVTQEAIDAYYAACGVVSNRTTRSVVNPVMSTRISTRGKKSVRFGKVEVRARMPVG